MHNLFPTNVNISLKDENIFKKHLIFAKLNAKFYMLFLRNHIEYGKPRHKMGDKKCNFESSAFKSN